MIRMASEKISHTQARAHAHTSEISALNWSRVEDFSRGMRSMEYENV